MIDGTVAGTAEAQEGKCEMTTKQRRKAREENEGRAEWEANLRAARAKWTAAYNEGRVTVEECFLGFAQDLGEPTRRRGEERRQEAAWKKLARLIHGGGIKATDALFAVEQFIAEREEGQRRWQECLAQQHASGE